VKVKDESHWAQQASELQNTDEDSRKFHDFLVLWLDTADQALEKGTDLSPYTELSKAFEVAEQTLGYLSVEWLGQMLLVVIGHWVHGDLVWESLTVWEKRMVEQSIAIKLVELQEQAAQDAEKQ
jgi:hypothetical protein